MARLVSIHRKRRVSETFTRTRPLTFEKRQAEGDADPVFDVAISSETDEVERWFGREILLHGPRNVDLSRLRTVAGVLLNHDPDQLVGAIVDPRVDDDRVLRIGVRFDKTQRGQDARISLENGSLRGASLRYAYRDYREIEAGKTATVNGKTIEGPARIVRRWTVIEPTLTPVPADATVGVGRSEETVMFKWLAEATDGSLLKRFKTKKAAEDWVAEQDGDLEFEVRKIEPTQARGRHDDEPDPEPRRRERRANDRDDTPDPPDEAAIEKRARERLVKDTAELRTIGEMAGESEYVEGIIRSGKPFDVEEERAEIAARWQKKQCKDRKPPNGAEPPRGGPEGIARLDDESFVRNATRTNMSDLHIEARPGLLRAQDYRDLLNNDDGSFQRRLNALYEAGTLLPEQFSLRAAFELYHGVNVRQLMRDPVLGERFVTSSAFSVICGSTVIAKLREAYENVDTIGDKLVTEMDNQEKVATVPAVLTEQSLGEIQEGQPYPRAGAAEEYVTIPSKKQGVIVPVTREAINRDQTGVFLMRINQTAENAINAVEKHTLRQITDQDTLTYFLSGTAQALYSATAADRPRGINLKTSNALVDDTDLDNARLLLDAMQRNEGDPINVQPRQILVPRALVATAGRLLRSTMTPGTENEWNSWGPQGDWRPEILSSPFLDTFTNGTTDWYLGDFKKQFIRKSAFGIETTTKGADSEAAFDSDVVFQAKVAFDKYVAALDYVYVIKSSA